MKHADYTHVSILPCPEVDHLMCKPISGRDIFGTNYYLLNFENVTHPVTSSVLKIPVQKIIDDI